MQDGKTLTERVQRQLENSSDATATAAGPTGSRDPRHSAQDKSDIVNAVNQGFAELELVYHNQYNKAFATPEKEQYAKRLWFSNLQDYSAEQILAAIHRAIRESEYLPTIRGILKYLENDFERHGLPDTRSAYLEACRAPSPKANFDWSHPAVYHAGVASDWYFLANNPESKSYPVFERNYQLLCQRVIKGEELAAPLPKALPEKVSRTMSREQQKQALQQLRDDTGI